MKKTRTLDYSEPTIICEQCGCEVEATYCAGCGDDHSFDDADEVIYCDGREHYCEKCGKARSKRKKNK